MATDGPAGDPLEIPKSAGRTLYGRTLNVLMTGVAIIVPFVITVYVLGVALEFVRKAFEPFVGLLRWLGVIGFFEAIALDQVGFLRLLVQMNVYIPVMRFLAEFIALAVLVVVIFVVGTTGRNRFGEQIVDGLDRTIAAVPGVGTVYTSFRRMGNVMVEGGTENFKDVKLVEWRDGVYVIGFVTDDTGPDADRPVGSGDLVTVFVPLAPNPVTGGFLTYVARDRLVDVDMSLEEGIRNILTSGVAGEKESGTAGP